jgi:sigma-B regulation protein RsbU (phosphoserine phosphatase)
MQHDLLSKEVSQAREIQLNWLPGRHKVGALDIAAVNQPANHISGDFYNWFNLPDGRQAVIIGDVTGHGMAAAFLMATTQLLVRTTMSRITDPGRCMEEVNRQLCTQVFRGQFVTMLILILDVERGIAEVATAGHHPPMVSDGLEFKSVKLASQLVLAVDSSERYSTETFKLANQAHILLYTDGLLDVQNPAGDRFGAAGLSSVLARQFENAQSMIDAIVEAVKEFRGPRELEDDLTLVAIQLQPTNSGSDDVSSTGDGAAMIAATQ